MSSHDLGAMWLSGHIHFDGRLYGAAGDRIVLEIVEPFVRHALTASWIDRFFFVRYNEDGPHIRLRVRGVPERLRDMVHPTLAQAAGDTLRWVPYMPETDRYGGPAALPTAESCFEASSFAAFALLRRIETADRSSRLAKALLAMLVLVYVFTRDRDSARVLATAYEVGSIRGTARDHTQNNQWSRAFEEGYLRQASSLSDFVNDVWDRLSNDEPLLPELDRYRDDLTTIHSELARLCAAGYVSMRRRRLSTVEQTALTIAPSYIHMMSNRLGVTIPEEAYLAHAIARALEAPLHRSAR